MEGKHVACLGSRTTAHMQIKLSSHTAAPEKHNVTHCQHSNKGQLQTANLKAITAKSAKATQSLSVATSQDYNDV